MRRQGVQNWVSPLCGSGKREKLDKLKVESSKTEQQHAQRLSKDSEWLSKMGVTIENGKLKMRKQNKDKLKDTPKCRSVVFKTKKMISLRLGVFVRDMALLVLHSSVQDVQNEGSPRCGS